MQMRMASCFAAGVEREDAAVPDFRASPIKLPRAPGWDVPAPRDDGASSSEIVLLNEDGRITAVNQAWRDSVDHRGLRLQQYGVGDCYVDLACQFLPDLDRDDLLKNLHAVRVGEVEQILRAFAVQTARGPRWRQLQIRPMVLDGHRRFVAIHEDLTELARAQEALRATSERLLHAQEDERQRIALELHDSTSQHLAALGLGLTRLRRLERGSARKQVLDEMGAALREAVKETRVLAYLLKPNGLVQEGLEVTARRFAEGFGARTGLAVSFAVAGDLAGLAAPVEHAAFRIVQEALANVYRHAHAKAVEVELNVTDAVLTVRIRDNGRGLPPALGRSPDGPPLGVGIVGMRSRVEQLGGDLHITSTPTGTRVQARFPLAL